MTVSNFSITNFGFLRKSIQFFFSFFYNVWYKYTITTSCKICLKKIFIIMVNHFGTGVQSIFSDHNLSFLIVQNYVPPSFYIHLSSIDIICITFFWEFSFDRGKLKKYFGENQIYHILKYSVMLTLKSVNIERLPMTHITKFN